MPIYEGTLADDTLQGGPGDDHLVGFAGTDRLDGGPGADTMVGGGDPDRYVVDDPADVVVEDADEASSVSFLDRVDASVSFVLPGFVELLTLTGTADIDGTGNALPNDIVGNDGDNRLDGRAGRDDLWGGRGNDTLIAGADDDGGFLRGILNGGDGDDHLHDAEPGTATTGLLLEGGAGNDTYHVVASTDIVERAGEGDADEIVTTGPGFLPDQVENLTMLGTAAAATGNALANRIVANAADNVVLAGAGGDSVCGGDGDDWIRGEDGDDTLDGGNGADTLHGGAGDDLFRVDDRADRVVEDAGAGTDTVRAGVGWTLDADVEHLVLLAGGRTNGTGNALANRVDGTSGTNRLAGGAGDDTLNGEAGDDRLDGGSGADLLAGGSGRDVYLVDHAGDRVRETSTDDTEIDTVRSLVSYTLGDHLERLALDGAAAVDATGNARANLLVGNAAANTIDGRAGRDTLTGGAGADTFRFSTAPLGAANADRVTDFRAVDDRLAFDDAVFAGLGRAGVFAATAFRAGGAALDADDRLVYDAARGLLRYDADGSGAGAAVLVATFTPGTVLTLADLFLV